ncbi:glycerol channel [Tieghemiomyces parasiticus]|uniref:Glycerol channel n=1 Tax=Tieghemiomyces parasiticus TaxID=78921 RepID=A0A9W8A5J2_9FUNG|nr:glycerol channel [Tieghemiomyces parasiticus]
MSHQVHVNSETSPLLADGHDSANTVQREVNAVRHRFHETFAEFFGTYVFVFLGLAINASLLTQVGATAGPAATLLCALGWGLSLALGIAVAAPISGGHVNPAVTLAMVAHRQFPAAKALCFLAAQIIGSVAAAATLHAVYAGPIRRFSHDVAHGHDATANIFVTHPGADASNLSAFFAELVGTAVLLIAIVAHVRSSNSEATKAWTPYAAGLTLFILATAFGPLSGGGFNPARDFGPRLYILIAGWGWSAISAHSYYFWIPVVAPVIGGSVGTLLFDIFA